MAESFSEFYLTGAGTLLLAELLTFTASEKNSAVFEAERSEDGNRFARIGKVAARPRRLVE